MGDSPGDMRPGAAGSISDQFRLRLADESDLAAIVEVEQQGFASPWPVEAFAQEMRNAWSIVEVLEDPAGRIVAHIVYWIVEDELHLLNIAVDPSVRNQGIAKSLFGHLERVCRERRLTYITLEVRVGNAVAIGLYEGMGFETIHRRKRYYVDNGEDALVMAKVLG